MEQPGTFHDGFEEVCALRDCALGDEHGGARRVPVQHHKGSQGREQAESVGAEALFDDGVVFVLKLPKRVARERT